jgi:L-ascorbate metabolism protein UlaG (beta-lactamase superfamily)
VTDVVPDERILAVQPGDSVDLGVIRAHVVPAFHGIEPADAYGDGSSLGGLPRFVGYIFDSRPTLYHAGDTIVTRELIDVLARLQIDVALLPINGRDAIRESRGIVGNMNAAEAVELALTIGAAALIPYHWDGFEGNTVPPGAVVDLADARLHVVAPARFVPLELPWTTA